MADEDDVPDALTRLRTIYPNILKLDYDNTRTRTSTEVAAAEEMERKSELELFEEFFLSQNGQEMSEEQRAFAGDLLERVKEEMQ